MNTVAIPETQLDWRGMTAEDIKGRRNAIYDLRSWIQAREKASARPDVQAFRNNRAYFPDSLLPPDGDALAAWLELHRGEVHPGSASDQLNIVRIEAAFESGVTAPGSFPIAQPLAGDLNKLATKLADEYGWEFNSTILWLIMRHWSPKARGVGLRILKDGMVDVELNDAPDKSIEFLTMRISAPADTPPHLLLYEIQNAQARIAPKYAYPVPSTARPYLDTTLEAVRFALDRNDGRSWLDVLSEWKVLYPESEFQATAEGAAAFGAIVRRCYSQVMGEKLVWKRRPGKSSANHHPR